LLKSQCLKYLKFIITNKMILAHFIINRTILIFENLNIGISTAKDLWEIILNIKLYY